ncbi:MAG: response regulator [Ignavibacteriales bacterium]|nr:response regulator [Ignavibacteriales bacterium]
MKKQSEAPMVTERRKKVLIVDDESSMVSVLQRHVSNAGYEFVSASNGQEALEKIEKEEPDLVLLDLVMPGMNGFETCRRIRENEKTKKLPVLIITALRGQSDSAAATASGANEFIVKPIDGAELAKRLRARLGSPFKV